MFSPSVSLQQLNCNEYNDFDGAVENFLETNDLSRCSQEASRRGKNADSVIPLRAYESWRMVWR
jgi:hypothetical protein